MLDVEAPAAGVAHETGGGVQQLVAQGGGFGDAQLAVEGERLHVDHQVVGGEDQLQPHRVAVEGVAGQVAGAGVLGAAPASPARSLRTLAPPAVVIVVALTVAAALDWLSMWTAVALGVTASVGAAVRLRRRQSPRQALAARPPESVREVVPDGSAEALTAPAQQQEPGSRRGPTAEPDQVWDQITAYLRSNDGTKPTQRELAAELRRSRTSISEAIQAHRQEWDDLTATANSSADGTGRRVAQPTGA